MSALLGPTQREVYRNQKIHEIRNILPKTQESIVEKNLT